MARGAVDLRDGLRLARFDRVILAVIVATVFVNGGGEAYGRLLDHQLVVIGMPTHPALIFWFAALSLVGVALGALALRSCRSAGQGAGVIKRTYVLSCIVGVAGLVLFANAPNIGTAVAGSLLVSGLAMPLSRTAAVIWVNRRTTAGVRATVHSLVSQAEQTGEIVFGLSLAGLAAARSATVALTGSADLAGLRRRGRRRNDRAGPRLRTGCHLILIWCGVGTCRRAEGVGAERHIRRVAFHNASPRPDLRDDPVGGLGRVHIGVCGLLQLQRRVCGLAPGSGTPASHSTILCGHTWMRSGSERQAVRLTGWPGAGMRLSVRILPAK